MISRAFGSENNFAENLPKYFLIYYICRVAFP